MASSAILKGSRSVTPSNRARVCVRVFVCVYVCACVCVCVIVELAYCCLSAGSSTIVELACLHDVRAGSNVCVVVQVSVAHRSNSTPISNACWVPQGLRGPNAPDHA